MAFLDLPKTYPFARFVLRFARHLSPVSRPASGPSHDHLPAERLADMGLPPRTEANRRHSGQAGPIPQAPLW